MIVFLAKNILYACISKRNEVFYFFDEDLREKAVYLNLLDYTNSSLKLLLSIILEIAFYTSLNTDLNTQKEETIDM